MKHLQIIIKYILALFLLLGMSSGLSAQLLPGYLSGQATIGANPALLHGNLIVGDKGELYFGNHIPHLQQTNTLYLIGNYEGELGARTYQSVINNSNSFGSRGFIDIIGTATGSTEIMLDMFTGWDGSCIDLARAYNSGSDAGAFTMAEASFDGHLAYLKSRVYGGDRIWYLAERMILDAFLYPGGQVRCMGSLEPFSPLTVVTPTTGNYLYQWYRKSGAPSDSRDFSNSVPVGSLNGGQTSVYTPVINTDTTYYYYCVVRNASCSEYNIDTTDVSGAITMSGEPKIHLYGSNLCVGIDTLFVAEIYEGNPNGVGTWHVSDGFVASIDAVTGRITAHNRGKFTVTYYYTTPDGCSTYSVSQEYEVFAKPVALVEDKFFCTPQSFAASSLVVNLVDADYFKIFEADGVTEITGQYIQATYDTVTYLVEAYKNGYDFVSERAAVRVSVIDAITFDLPSLATICTGSSATLIDLSDLVSGVKVSEYKVEVYDIEGNKLSGTLVPVSDKPYTVKLVSGDCTSDGKSIVVVESNGNVRITKQPLVQSYNPEELSDYVNFFVTAEGASSYQWYQIEKDTIITKLSGETSPVLSIPVSDINPAASYYVEVTGGCNNSPVKIKSDVVYADACRPLIVQKKNHTLLVDNNSSNNGGLSFVYYEWYKNNELIHKGSHGMDFGGMYNTGTGGGDLNPSDSYYVIATEESGRKYRTCAYHPVTFIYGTRITAYPNPATTASSLVVVDVETDDEELLENGVITSYNVAGQYLGRVRTEGHRVTPVQLPSVSGVYILKFVSGDVEKEMKIIVQ